MEDYYAILGLDPGASPESVKLAYRRLARENHPDRNIHSTEVEKSALSLQMSQLNGAYSVLSDPTRRREYDEKLRVLSTLGGATTSKTATSISVAKTTTKSNANHRVMSDADCDLALEFSKQLRTKFLANRKGFSWKEISVEGFDWGLESVSWTSHYCVAARGFAVLDLMAAKKFANYSEAVVSRFTRSVRKSNFLFLLPFQHLSQWESASAEFNRLLSSKGLKRRQDNSAGIILFDSQRGQTLRVGSRLKEKQFEELLLSLGLEISIAR